MIAAGPLQHVWMAGVAYGLYMLGILPEYWHYRFFDFNLMVLMFNLLPVWPLDGGKLIFLLLSYRKPFPEAHLQTIFISTAVLGSVYVAYLLIGAIYFECADHRRVFVIFVIFEWKHRRYVFLRFLMERYYGNQGEFRLLLPINVTEEDELADVLERFQRGCKHQVIVKRRTVRKRLSMRMNCFTPILLISICKQK